MTQFQNISDMKRQPTEKSPYSGLPNPMAKQIEEGPPPMRRPLKFPSPDKASGGIFASHIPRFSGHNQGSTPEGRRLA